MRNWRYFRTHLHHLINTLMTKPQMIWMAITNNPEYFKHLMLGWCAPAPWTDTLRCCGSLATQPANSYHWWSLGHKGHCSNGCLGERGVERGSALHSLSKGPLSIRPSLEFLKSSAEETSERGDGVHIWAFPSVWISSWTGGILTQFCLDNVFWMVEEKKSSKMRMTAGGLNQDPNTQKV